MKTPSELIYAYEQGERAPDDAFLRAARTLDQIQVLLSGKEWVSGTCAAIADVMAAQGYEIADVPTVPAGATHIDIPGDDRQRPTLEAIRTSKHAAEQVIAEAIMQALKSLHGATGIHPRGLSMNTEVLTHIPTNKALVTEIKVSIDMGAI